MPTVTLAPMAGITDWATRTLARSFCPDLHTVTEMISAKALCFGDKKTMQLLRPCAGANKDRESVQIFGSDPDTMAKAAVIAANAFAAQSGHPPASIDLNMGCPTPKITKNNDGAALMRDPVRAASIVRAVVRAVSPLAVTVKTRLGWDSGQIDVTRFAANLADAGANAICIHGRTKVQGYSGHADWRPIAETVRAVSIPIIANGDLFTPQDAEKCLRQTGASGVAIGRATFGNLRLCAQIHAVLHGLPPLPAPSYAEKMQDATALFALLREEKGDHIAVLEMRRHLCWFLRGERGSHVRRQTIMQMQTVEDVARQLRPC